MHDHAGDDELLGIFRQLGVDLNKPREINFYFVFPTESQAEKATKLLSDRKYESEVYKLDVPWWKRLFAKPSWSVAVTQMLPLDESKIKQTTTLFQQIAQQAGGVYDGWEASVEGENISSDQLETM